MSEQTKNEKPEVYALRQDSGSWQISRRDFLKAAGVGAAVAGTALTEGYLRAAFAEESLDSVCSSAPAHKDAVKALITSVDGRYLLSYSDNMVKCWNFQTFVLEGKQDVNVSNYASAFIHGLASWVYIKGNNAYAYQLPDIGKSNVKLITQSMKSSQHAQHFAAGKKDILFILTSNGEILKYEPEGSEIVYKLAETLETVEKLDSGFVFDNDRKMFVKLQTGECGVVDLSDGTFQQFDVSLCRDYAPVPGGLAVLILVGEKDNAKEYRLYSLSDGKIIWQQESSMVFHRAAVTPDGSMAVLLMDSRITLRSMTDGALIRSENYGVVSFDSDSCLAVSGDGSKLAVSKGNSILFFSLPDLKLIGCPVDLKEMKDNTKGVEVKGVDAATGKTVTYTLPCNAAIPAGAVCTCNCVKGRGGCAVNCRCVGNTCSCNSNRSSYSTSYWYPN